MEKEKVTKKGLQQLDDVSLATIVETELEKGDGMTKYAEIAFDELDRRSSE